MDKEKIESLIEKFGYSLTFSQIDQAYREHYAALTPEGLKLIKEERNTVNIPCENACGQELPDFASEICLDCIIEKFCKAQLSKVLAWHEADKQKAVEEAVAAKSIIYARAGDMAIKEATNKIFELLGDLESLGLPVDSYTKLSGLKKKWQALKIEDK